MAWKSKLLHLFLIKKSQGHKVIDLMWFNWISLDEWHAKYEVSISYSWNIMVKVYIFSTDRQIDI